MRTGLIVEDLPEARKWLSAVLQVAFPGIELREAGSCAEAHAALTQGGADLALVDLGLPDGSGLEVIGALKRPPNPGMCVVTTVFDDDQHLFAALRAGADGYLLKDQSRHEMVDLLRGISEGRPPLSPAIARHLLGFFRTPPAPVDDGLTGREREVLTLIAKGCTIARVAELLGISRNTAAGYVKEVYRKLNVSSRAEAALEATRRGIVKPELG